MRDVWCMYEQGCSRARFQNEGLISGRVNGGEKDSDGREIEVFAVERVWIWMFQPCGACTVESVDKANG